MARIARTTQTSLQNKPSSSIGRLNKLMFATIVGLVVFEALISNAKASNGSRLVELQQQYDELQLQVTSLELEIATYASLSHIKHYATETMDMKPVENNILYMTEPQPTGTP